MEDDLIAGLTRQVKEDVIENYLRERRLAILQVESLQKQAGRTRAGARIVSKRLNRLAYLMIDPEIARRVLHSLNIPPDSYWALHSAESLSKKLRFIRVSAFTEKGRFKKLVLETYRRLHHRMGQYSAAYEDLQAECLAVNGNLKNFQSNFDLLAILNFLRTLDTLAIEKKQILGENFTAEEMSSLDERLYIRPVPFEKLDLPVPLALPAPERLEALLLKTANEVYKKHQTEVRRMMK